MAIPPAPCPARLSRRLRGRLRRVPGARLALALLCAGAAQAVDAAALGTELRLLAAQAAAANPLTSAPLLPAPGWAPSTAYESGVVVRNGAALYICRRSGTSAASGGPTGSGSPGMYADIVDSGAAWEYYGSPVVTSADPAAPAIASQASVPAGLGSRFGPIDQAASFRFAGGVATANPGQPLNQVSFPCVTISGAGTGGNVGLNDGHSDYNWSATFVTDAPKLAIGVSYNPTPANIIIDGRRLMPGGFQGSGGGNPAYYVLDFAAAGGRKQRTITIEDYGNIAFAGVWVDAASTVAAPAPAHAIRAAFFGSSIECGGNAFPLRGDLGWPAQAAKLLGWEDARNLGLGGTGYINSQGGSSLNYAQHLADAVAIAPDVVVVGGPINDELQDPAVLKAAAVGFLGQVRTALPHALIIALGTFPAASGPSTSAIASEQAIADAVQQLTDPLTYFVPLSTAGGGSFITGTGNVSAPTGRGNADLYISDDGTHPDQAGIDYIAHYYAERISTLVIQHIGIGAATLSSFTPSSGPVGTVVTISGSGFTGATAVDLAGSAMAFAVTSDTAITATVPSGAGSGTIAVGIPSGTLASSGVFTVTSAPPPPASPGGALHPVVSGSGGSCGTGAAGGIIILGLACLAARQRR